MQNVCRCDSRRASPLGACQASENTHLARPGLPGPAIPPRLAGLQPSVKNTGRPPPPPGVPQETKKLDPETGRNGGSRAAATSPPKGIDDGG